MFPGPKRASTCPASIIYQISSNALGWRSMPTMEQLRTRRDQPISIFYSPVPSFQSPAVLSGDESSQTDSEVPTQPSSPILTPPLRLSTYMINHTGEPEPPFLYQSPVSLGAAQNMQASFNTSDVIYVAVGTRQSYGDYIMERLAAMERERDARLAREREQEAQMVIYVASPTVRQRTTEGPQPEAGPSNDPRLSPASDSMASAPPREHWHQDLPNRNGVRSFGIFPSTKSSKLMFHHTT